MLIVNTYITKDMIFLECTQIKKQLRLINLYCFKYNILSCSYLNLNCNEISFNLLSMSRPQHDMKL